MRNVKHSTAIVVLLILVFLTFKFHKYVRTPSLQFSSSYDEENAFSFLKNVKIIPQTNDTDSENSDVSSSEKPNADHEGLAVQEFESVEINEDPDSNFSEDPDEKLENFKSCASFLSSGNWRKRMELDEYSEFEVPSLVEKVRNFAVKF